MAVFKPCLGWFDPSDLPLSCLWADQFDLREIFHRCPQQKSAHAPACLESKSTVSSLLSLWTASGRQWKRCRWMDEEHAFVNVSPTVTAALCNCLLGYTRLDGLERLLNAVGTVFRTAAERGEKNKIAECRWWLTQASPVVFGCVKPKHVSAADAPKQMVRNANRQNHPNVMCVCGGDIRHTHTHGSEQNGTETMLLVPQSWSGWQRTVLRCKQSFSQDCLRILNQPDGSCQVCRWDEKLLSEVVSEL